MAKRKVLTGNAPGNDNSDDTYWDSDLDFAWAADDPTLSMRSFNPLGGSEHIVLPPESVLYSEDLHFEEATFTGGKWGAFAAGTPGGTVTWSIAGAGLTNATGQAFFTGNSVTLASFLPADFLTQITNAFAAWSAVANINFTQVADGGGNAGIGTTAAIRIFGGNIDGAGGTAGFGFFPPANRAPIAADGDIVFDSNNGNWTSQLLFGVALHEIGHTLGLGHVPQNMPVAIMNPSVPLNVGLQPDDIAGIQAIYGARPAAPMVEFQTPVQKVSGFSPSTGWSSQDLYPRAVADVNGDNLDDIVGFGPQGVWVSLATGGGNFGNATLGATGFNPSTGWSSDNLFHRELADVNGDNRADLVGFGPQGVWVSLALGGGNFGNAALGATGFNPSTGWSSQDAFPRHLADVNADNMADLVGFGPQGVWVSLALDGGNFGNATLRATGFNPSTGWTSDNTTPRHLADVNGDNRADIVGFASDGVYVSLALAGGNFGNAFRASNAFGSSNAAGGWSSQNTFPRELADIDGDNRADIVGFGGNGVWIALGPLNVNGAFGTPRFDVASYAPGAGGWSNNDTFPRMLGDVNGDNFADILGFGGSGVWESLSNGFHLT